MNSTKLTLAIFLGLLSFIFQSCKEDEVKHKQIRSTSSKLNFLSPRSGSKFVYGDTIHFEVESDDKTKQVEKLSLYVNDVLIDESSNEKLSYDYPTRNGGGGQLRIKAMAFYSDSSSSRKRMGLTVLSDSAPLQLSYQLINTYYHDPTSFTQGLIYDPIEDLLFEGTGNYTESRLLKSKLGEKEAVLSIDIADDYFGEGITVFKDTVFQLTYKNKKGFYYDRDFNKLGEFIYPTEGWGLTHNEDQLIMSDGSPNLYFIDPNTFKIEKTIQVFSDKGQVYNLNELEYVNGIIYANIYTTDYIAKIDAHDGRLLAMINMEGLLKKEDKKGKIDVLNGIAFNPSYQSFYVTGKWWPKLFEVRFVEE